LEPGRQVATNDLLSEARAAFELATIDPPRARQMAEGLQPRAQEIGDWATVSVCFHAIGVAAKLQSDLAGSQTALTSAIRAARRAGSAELTAEARVSMAGTLILSGRTTQALRVITSAVADLDGVAAAKARTQQAAILQLAGRDDRALAVLRLALPVLRRSGEADWTARALSNRSLLHITRRSFRLAEADLLAAQRLCAEHQLTSWSAYVEHNLGWLMSSRGEVIAALEHFDAAEQMYRVLGSEAIGALQEGKAKLFLAVRLMQEARASAEEAVAAHQRQQRKLQAVDAQLLLSTVALVQGDYSVAEAAAIAAYRGFRRLDRPSGVALAKWAIAQAEVAADAGAVKPSRLRHLAEELANAGWLVPSLDARLAAGRLALAGGSLTRAQDDLSKAAGARVAGPADARARGWFAEALLRESQGRRSSAKRAVAAGLRVLETHQATLGATELRAHFSRHRGELALMGLRLAVADGDARRVLSFVEQVRATALALRSPRPPEDPVLAAALADLRATIGEIDGHRSAGRATEELVQRQVRLERTIADRCRLFPAAAGTRHSSRRRLSDLTAAADRAVIVEYFAVEDQLHVVTLVDGRARLRRLGSIKELPHRLLMLSFVLRRMASPTATSARKAAALRALHELRSELHELLFAPIEAQLANRAMVIVPAASLRSVPWSLLPSLVGRPVTIAPSARLWLSASERSRPGPSDPITVVAGPGLPGAIAEVRAVADLYPHARCLANSESSTQTVTAAMDGAAMVHIAAHGLLRSDNPFFSALILADGPLILYELERLQRAPYHVILAACEAASPSVIAPDELLGLASMLLAQGTASLVAPVTTVQDGTTTDFMLSYHRQLLAGHAPAEALSIAQQKASGDGDAEWATAASFVCVGAGNQPLPVGTGVLAGRSGSAQLLTH
jgi:CHAT domain-containing protein